jgi:hypothetical protein
MTGNAAAVMWIVCGTCAAQTCGGELGGTRRTVESAHYEVAYTTTPEPIAVGQHFVVDFAVCTRGNAASPQAVRVDANMPEHRHGMNYRAGVAGAGRGLYRAEGLLFHMPGRWQLTFDIVSAGTVERLSSTLAIE